MDVLIRGKMSMCSLVGMGFRRHVDDLGEAIVEVNSQRSMGEKYKTTVEHLQDKLTKLRTVADDLERVHQRATIGSLAGSVIGAMGGITAVVGLILAPFTLGASLIVTGVGVGVSTLGGVAAGASNITNMVNQSSDRKAVRSIIKEFEEKINAVVTWLQEICNTDNLARLGLRAGRGLGAIPELIRLVQVVNIGKIAAQATRAVRVAEAVTGVLSALFLAVDIFFIAVDAKEIHHIRQAKAAEERTNSQPVSETETEDSVSTFDKAVLVVKELDTNPNIKTFLNACTNLFISLLPLSLCTCVYVCVTCQHSSQSNESRKVNKAALCNYGTKDNFIRVFKL
uniref:Uncharacterized protein n=1 Tax=Monopterus albus TaxID=43700 RepID=A0A3Q3IFM1_MONAL